MTDYQKQAQDFLEKHGITFTQTLIGSDCPAFCEDAAKRKDMDKVDTFPRKSHVHGKHYRCTFGRKEVDPQHMGRGGVPWKSGTLTVDFWNSYADEEFNAAKRANSTTPNYYQLKDKYKASSMGFISGSVKLPSPYDVLASITKSEPGTFEDFCSNYGYDSDSRRAYALYESVHKEWRQVSNFFTAEEIEEMQEIS